jgi:hypothetical protein
MQLKNVTSQLKRTLLIIDEFIESGKPTQMATRAYHYHHLCMYMSYCYITYTQLEAME